MALQHIIRFTQHELYKQGCACHLLSAIIAGSIARDQVLWRLTLRCGARVGGVQVLDLVRQAALRRLVARILRIG